LLLAVVICVGHGAQLAGEPQLEWIADLLSSPYRISAFFVLSGFLIFRSYERSRTIASYARRRLHRIYPAYALVVVLCAVGLSAVSRVPADAYFSATWLRYVAANLSFLSFLQPTLPGVFEGNARPEINGALWTLKIEVMFYAAVPLFVWLFARLGRLPVMIAVYCLSIGYGAVMTSLSAGQPSGIYDELGRQLPGQLAFLMAGAFFYYYLPVIERHARAVVLVAAATLTLNMWLPLGLVEPLALAGVVIAVALFTPVVPMDSTRNTSYALFIVHFPIIQLFAHFGWFAGLPATFLLCVTGTSILAAVMLDRATQQITPVRSRREAPVSAEPAPAAT
jgi:peptidoglycan/LPS O-acetylase OafA/YrhL